jgi:dodecin
VAKREMDSVYRIVDVVGISEKSWEDAGRRAVETAAGSLRDLRVAEVTQVDMKVEDGKVTAFRTRVALRSSTKPDGGYSAAIVSNCATNDGNPAGLNSSETK